jgi:hypothetical protein
LRPRDARDCWQRGSDRCQTKKGSTGKFHEFLRSVVTQMRARALNDRDIGTRGSSGKHYISFAPGGSGHAHVLLQCMSLFVALNDFRCGAQNSVGIGAISDIKAAQED